MVKGARFTSGSTDSNESSGSPGENLQTTIEELQASNEELKSTNEELQSTNEELQSTNEEMETSKEELQSVNEELMTVNSELRAKIDQLSRSENDMRNLLDSTTIGTIFLDSHLNIKRVHLGGHEDHQPHPLRRGQAREPHSLQPQLRTASPPMPRQCSTPSSSGRWRWRPRKGNWYIMRIMPYRTAEKRDRRRGDHL